MRNRQIVLCGFSLPLVFILLNSVNWFGNWLSSFYADRDLTGVVLIVTEAVSFLIPTFFLSFLWLRGMPMRLRLKKFPVRALGFVVSFSLSISLLSFIVNYAVASFFPIYQAPGAVAGETRLSLATLIFAIVVVPAFCEELYLRGALFSVYESCGTGYAILLSGLAFAMIHASPSNFFGPLFAGMAYAYITFILNSVWPAILCHTMNNAFALLMDRLITTYAAFGIWPYFLAICIIGLLVFAWMAMQTLEHMVARKMVPQLVPPSEPVMPTLAKTFLSPGFLLFFTLVLIKMILLP